LKKEIDPKDSAIYGLMAVFFCHLFFILNIVNYFLKRNILELVFEKEQSKYVFLPIVILIMIIIHKFYKNRIEKIIEKYKDKENVLNWSNSLLVIMIIIGPLLLGIYFLNNG
jgi:hypothetical protein